MRYRILLLLLTLLTVLCSCKDKNLPTEPISGKYYVVGDYEAAVTPYVLLSTDDHFIRVSPGDIISYSEQGSYHTENGQLIAVTQNTAFVFEILDPFTLKLVTSSENGYDAFADLEGETFVYYGDEHTYKS